MNETAQHETNEDWRKVLAKQLAQAPMYVLLIGFMSIMVWLNYQRDMLAAENTRRFIEVFGEYEERNARAMESMVELEGQEREFQRTYLEQQREVARALNQIIETALLKGNIDAKTESNFDISAGDLPVISSDNGER